MQLKNIVEGTHNKEYFRYDNGKVNMFGRVWDKADIKTLVEAANLLHHEGYTLKEPIGTKTRQVESMFGGIYSVEEKEYDEREDD